MKKLIPLLLPILTFANYQVSCVGQISAPKVSNLKFQSSAYEMEDGYPLLDPVNFEIYYYDNDSAICGGSKEENTLIAGSCSSEIDSCWDVITGKSGELIIDYNAETKEFFNNVIVVNNYPCLPRQTKTFTSGLFDYNSGNNYEPPFIHANLSKYRVEDVEYVSSEVAKQQRIICKASEPDPSADYTEQLNTLIDNTSENKNIKELNERNKNLDSNLDNYISSLPTIEDTQQTQLTDFQTSYETTLDETYSLYSDVFGFGGYGSAPAPISFTFLGNTYEVFNINMINDYLELIRNTFSIFAYLWGIIIVFRGV